MNYFTSVLKKLWPKKIRSQLILGIVIVHLLLMAIFVYDTTNRQEKFLKEQHLEQTKSMASEYALNAKIYIISNDLDGLERLTLAQSNFPKLKYAMVLSPEKKVLSHTNKHYFGTKPTDKISLGLKNIPETQVLLENNSIIDIASPVLEDNKIIGWVRVGIGQEYIYENLLSIVRQGIFYIAIALIIGFLVAIAVANKLSKKLYSLLDTSDKIRKGDRKIRVGSFETYELSKLGTAFNQMLDEIGVREEVILKANKEIGERVKELTCLYFLTKIVNDPEKSLRDILQECVNNIPNAYQYPEITTARITFDDQQCESKNFSVSKWKQEAVITSNNSKIGMIEVYYTSEMPDEEEGPFLKEERYLIDSIADIIGSASKRRKAEAAIKEQADTFQAIIENTKESIYLISPECKVLQFNKTAKERIRISRGLDLYTGMDFREIVFPESIEFFRSMFEDALKGISRTEEMKDRGKRGEDFWLQIKTSPVYDPEGNQIGVTLLAEAINDRKKAEAELRESEEKFRSLVEQSLIGVYIIRNNKLIYVNPGFKRIFGYSNDQSLDSMTFKEFVHPDDLVMIRNKYYKRISEDAPPDQYIFRGIKSDGSVLHLEVIASTIIYNGSPAVIGTLIDITSRVNEEKQIEKAVNEAQENERIQIGMELHDNVKQILAASLMTVDFIQEMITENKEAVLDLLNNLQKYTREAIDELRRLSHQLAPSINTEHTLKEKVEQLIFNMNTTKDLRVLVEVDEFDIPLNNDIQTAFYRILQEQFNNIIKYAGASTVLISIKQNNNNIYLRIKDDGKGFDTTISKAGIGLENIKRRTNILGGETKIVSSPGHGCEVTVQIPYQIHTAENFQAGKNIL